MTLNAKNWNYCVYTIIAMCSIGLSACNSNSPQSVDQTTMQEKVDYDGNWMTMCLPLVGQGFYTARLELNDGEYRAEGNVYSGQDCNSSDNQTYSEIETGNYTINAIVAVPSGVVTNSVSLNGISKLVNGELLDISGEPAYNDWMHRDGNTLIRAKDNPFGVAGLQQSEELDFSVVYYLQE